ncbi:MAG: hypothetical protein RJR35_09865 [Thermoanaerobacterales bacterium]|nr:hypothetical protein [Thermoanaerobacterales bacterium]
MPNNWIVIKPNWNNPFFGCGALDRSSKTWADIGNISKKAKCILILAYLGVVMIVIGFGLQIIAVYSSNS